MALHKIIIKQKGSSPLLGIQFILKSKELTETSPMFQLEDWKEYRELIVLKEGQDVRKIGMKRYADPRNGRSHYIGIQLYGKDDEMIVDETWGRLFGNWIYKEIPQGEKLVGFFGTIDQNREYISHLGFLTCLK